MKAFHGDEAVKQKYLARLKAHHAADEIIQGQGWNGSHGCAVGCTLNEYDPKAYENELGLPQWLARLEDRIFEGLPAVEAKQFAVDFLEAVPVGADVENVRWKLASQRHARDRDRLSANPEPYAVQCVAALDLVIAYCDSEVKTESARSAAESAAASVAWSVAWSVAASSAASAAWSVAWSVAASVAASAWSATWSARSAAAEWSAWSAAAEWSARSDHFKWEAATLLELLRNAPQAAE
jgi:hypothetical protein